MKKLIVSVAMGIMVIAFGALANATDVVIDGVKVPFNETTGFPIIENGRTLVPLRVAMEAYGANVAWDAENRIVRVTKGINTVCLGIDEAFIYRNGTKIENDVAAKIINGRTYLPIRAVFEALDAREVSWDGSVKVTSDGAGGLIHSIEASGSHVSNLWKNWEEALSYKANGNYTAAIEKIKCLTPDFLAANDGNSNAMLYKHLGECYSSAGMNDEASSCFKREASFWSQMGKEQETIDANRRAELIKSTAQIYVKTTNPDYYPGKYFGEPFEPQSGVYLAAYAEGDDAVHDASSMSKFYMNEFPKLAGKDMAAYHLYMRSDVPFSNYESHFKIAKEKNKIIQIALEPVSLSALNENDPVYIKLAQDMEASGVKLMVRFAGEMNELSCPWYTTDTQMYKEKFRIFARIFRKYAPSVAIVWSPNFYPSNNIEAYYPGDEYLDYVGISSYMNHQPETDPMGLGVDRNRWSNQLDNITSLYGYKKPIIVSEGGASYMDYNTWADITDFASSQLYDFLTYLPIKYHQVKAFFLFDNDRERYRFELSKNPAYLDAYKRGISGELYLSSPGEKRNAKYYEIGNNVKAEAKPLELASYIKTPENDISYVVYRINGQDVGTAYEIPYRVTADFSAFSSQSVRVDVLAFDSAGRKVAEKGYKINITQ